MSGFLLLVGLSTLMGLSIFLSLPVVLAKGMGSRTILFLNAAAIGILLFLVADIFYNAEGVLSPPGSGYVADPHLVGLFLVGFVGAFLVLFVLERRPGRSSTGPTPPGVLALVVAIAISFQNLTEGLVFGATWQSGIGGTLLVIFVGFFLQNITEGFPIAAPYLGSERPPLSRLAGYFLLGGVPTIVGGAVGYYWNSGPFDLVFDALAIGAILYALLPMLRMVFRPAAPPENTWSRINLVYVGIMVGFAVGFAVNAF